MGQLFSMSKDEQVELCEKWTANKNINPTDGNEINSHNKIYKDYEVLCMNILNDRLPASDESKKIILDNLERMCYNTDDFASGENFEDLDQKRLSDIIFLGEGEKMHCFILESLFDLISFALANGQTPQNPYTRTPITRDELDRVNQAINWKLEDIIKRCDLDAFRQFTERFRFMKGNEDMKELARRYNCVPIMNEFIDWTDEWDYQKFMLWMSMGCPLDIASLCTNLNIDGDNLTSLPAEIGLLTNLQELYCNSNELTSLPAEIENLTNLQTLDCNFNQLTFLPAEIGLLANLQKLDCSNNELTSLPAEIGLLANLQILSCGHNRLTSLPAEIGNLTNLQILYCSGNHIKIRNVPLNLRAIAQL